MRLVEIKGIRDKDWSSSSNNTNDMEMFERK